MRMPAPRATDAAIRRALAAWKDAGLPVGRMEVTAAGDIIISAPEAASLPEKPKQAVPREWRSAS